jgi:hypothetical protein
MQPDVYKVFELIKKHANVFAGFFDGLSNFVKKKEHLCYDLNPHA